MRSEGGTSKHIQCSQEHAEVRGDYALRRIVLQPAVTGSLEMNGAVTAAQSGNRAWKTVTECSPSKADSNICYVYSLFMPYINERLL